MWAGTKDDKEGLERYKREESARRIKELITNFYNNYKEFFDSGLIVISGSVVYNTLGLVKKDIFKDLDLNIKCGVDGDNFMLKLKDLKENEKIGNITLMYSNVRDDLSGVVYFDVGLIDLYRDNWDDSDVIGTCEVLPGVYTNYLSADHMTKNILKTYTYLKNYKDNAKDDKYLEIIDLKLKKHRSTFLDLINSGELSQNMVDKLKIILNE